MQALSKALTEDELVYLRAQFNLLEPKNGYVSLDNFKMVGDVLPSQIFRQFVSGLCLENAYFRICHRCYLVLF